VRWVVPGVRFIVNEHILEVFGAPTAPLLGLHPLLILVDELTIH
jgi:hypothetical protein